MRKKALATWRARWRTRLLELLIISRRPDVNTRLYTDISTHPDRFDSLEDAREKESYIDIGKDARRPTHNLRVLAVILLLFAIFMVIFLALVVKYGYLPNNSSWGN
jgi:hypothetical protein